MEEIESINRDSFNKLINNEEDYIISIEKIKKNLIFEFDQLEKDNIYVKKIIYLWNENNDNGIIFLDSSEIIFIEKNFKGNYLEYLIFIIPRITKLNISHLNKIIKDEEINNFDEKSNYNKPKESSNFDLDYINLLELNINNLQDRLQHLNDKIIPKVNFLEEQNLDLVNMLENHEKFTKNSLRVLEERISKLISLLEKFRP